MPWPFDMPLPRMEGYRYTLPVVLRRTDFADGTRWQRPPGGALRRQFTVTYDVDLDQLQDLMNYLHAQGFGETSQGGSDHWINIPLVSGETADGSPTDHTVRVIANPKIQRIEGAEEFFVELLFEDKGPPSFVNWPPR